MNSCHHHRAPPLKRESGTFKTGSENAVYLSLGRLERSEIARLAELALAEPEVSERINEASGADVRFLNYVMPVDIFVSEIPMYLPGGQAFGHQLPSTHDQRRYKIVFTMVNFGAADIPDGVDIIQRAINTEPVIEVWIDQEVSNVIAVHDPPETRIYGRVRCCPGGWCRFWLRRSPAMFR